MMKQIATTTKIAFVLLGALLIAGWPLASANAANLVFNAGFETSGGTPTSADGWELFSFGGLAERQTVMPHSGSAEVLLEGDPALGANFAVIVQRELPVVVGTDYKMSFFAKASAVDGPVGFRLEFYDGNDALIGGQFDLNVFVDSGLTSSYQQFSSIFTAPPTAATGTIVMFWEQLNGLTSVNWDDVFFEAVSAGDFNGDGKVDLSDYLLWKGSFGSTTQLAADGNGDGTINAADYTVWRDNLGASHSGQGISSISIPEPSTLVLGCAALMTLLRRRPRT